MNKLTLAAFILLSTFSAVIAQDKPVTILTKNTERMIPEGIALDAAGRIYVSSINERKIIVIEKDGSHRDFIPSGHDKFLEGLGMKVDEARNLLWVTSNRHEGNQFTSQVHAFDLTSKITRQYYHVTDTIPHLFNDIAIRADGKIFLTDTYYSAIYSIDPDKQKLELVVKTPNLDYPNGLVFGEKGQLYVATYVHGPVMLDLSNRVVTPLKGHQDSTAFGLDGLVWWNNSLIGVYNIGGDRARNSVKQYFLDKGGNTITRERHIDLANPLFYEPTTAALKNNKLYVLANSHLAVYNQNKQSIKGVENKLTPVAVVCYELK